MAQRATPAHTSPMAACVDELSRELRPPLTAEAALVEADRCLECGGPHAPAPCVIGCPADVDVPGFVAAIAAGDPGDGRTDHLRREPPRRDLRARLPGRGALPARLRPDPRGTAADRDRRAPALRDRVGVRERRAAARARADANGRRVAVVGAGPAGLAAAGELAARGYAVTVYDERDGGRRARPLRDRAVPADERAAARRGAAARASSASSSGSARESTRRACRSSLPRSTRSCSQSAWAPTLDVTYEGDDLDGVWESLPFIERLKTGQPPAVGERVAVIGGGNTAVDVAVEAKRLGAEVVAPPVPAHGAGDAGLRARGRARAATRESRSACSPAPSRFVGDGPRRRRSLRRDAARRPGRDRPPPARARSGQRVRHSRRHRRQGDRPAAARRVSQTLLESRRSSDGAHRETRRSLPPETPSTAARASSRPCAEAKRAVAAIDEALR